MSYLTTKPFLVLKVLYFLHILLVLQFSFIHGKWVDRNNTYEGCILLCKAITPPALCPTTSETTNNPWSFPIIYFAKKTPNKQTKQKTLYIGKKHLMKTTSCRLTILVLSTKTPTSRGILLRTSTGTQMEDLFSFTLAMRVTLRCSVITR